LGEIYLESAAPEIGAEWTNSRQRSEFRGPKHRDRGIGRTVPCSPELTAILHRHLEPHGITPDGRLFRSARSDGRLSSTVYGQSGPSEKPADLSPQVSGLFLQVAGEGFEPS
jgi:hypothetical protein